MEVLKMNKIEIARIFTFGTVNNKDIVRRLMACCESFKHLTFPDAIKQYRFFERSGLIDKYDDHLVIYFEVE